MNHISHHATRFVACAFLVALGAACSGQHHAGGTADAIPAVDAIPTPPCTPFDVSIPTDNVYGRGVWIGDRYVVVTSQGPSEDTVLQVVSADGVPGAQFATIPQSEGTVEPGKPYVWSGSSLGVLVTSNTPSTFELVRFAHDGTRLGQTTMMKNNTFASYPSLVWANDRFAVAWINMANNTVNLQEVSADGVLGTARTLTMNDVGTSFTAMYGFVSTSTSYAISLVNLSSPEVVVVVDRTSGAVHRYDTKTSDSAFYGADLVARDPDLVLFAGTKFETVDSSAMPGPVVNLPTAGLATVVPTTAGYHVYDVISPGGSTAMTSELDAMDLDAHGVSTGPEGPITTITWPPSSSRTSAAAGVFRGNGYAALVAYGTTGMSTLRMMQQCTP